MKKYLSAVADTTLYLIIFIVVQTVCIGLATRFIANQGMAFSIAMALSAIITLTMFQAFGFARLGRVQFARRWWLLLSYAALLASFLFLPSLWLMEQTEAEMPDQLTQLFQQLMQYPLGMLSISFLVPIVEEQVFRGAILGRLLRQDGCPPWVAIAISALMFALVHGNMAQAPHAFVIGLLLGWLAYRTGSIIPGIAFHWANNSLSLIATLLTDGEPDIKVIDLFGGNTTFMYTTLAITTLGSIAIFCCVYAWVGRNTPIKEIS